MAKSFSTNLKPKKTKAKPTDEEINRILAGEEVTPKVKVPEDKGMTRLHLRLPVALSERLEKVAKGIGISKSAIVKQGIVSELERLEKAKN